MVDLLEVVAEPGRRKLVQLLAQGEKTVTELTAEFSVTRSAISQQLLMLAEVGLVSARKEGRNRYYRLEPSGMTKLREIFDSFWTNELDLLVGDANKLHNSKRRGEL